MKALFNFARTRGMAIFLAAFVLFYAVSCQQFTFKNITPQKIVKIDRDKYGDKRFIVHAGSNGLYELTNLALNSSNLVGTLNSPAAPVYYSVERKSTYTDEEKGILNEVHIFLSMKYTELPLGALSIPVKDIVQTRVIQKVKSGAYIPLVFLGVLGLGFVISLASFSSMTSCPFIYAHDGENFVFEGETFGGAIGANLCRDDYMPLPSLQAHDGQYRLRISNELEERQYTDLAQLMVVEHPLNSRVLVDQRGQTHLLSQEQQPLSAQNYAGNDLTTTLQSKDLGVYPFNAENFSRNGVVLTFKKPAGTERANLILNAQNSIWVDHILDAYFSKFGNKFDLWMEKQSKRPATERMQNIRNSDLPLSIYLKKQGQWQLVDHLLAVGPLAARDLVVPIDLSGILADEIELKIETGFMFWGLDYAAIDFTPSTQVSTTFVKPSLAHDQDHQDWTAELGTADENFMPQKTIGVVTEIVYPASTASPGMTQTIFLHSRGYYELIRKYAGAPQVKELKKFRMQGSFAEFSRSEYVKLMAKSQPVPVF